MSMESNLQALLNTICLRVFPDAIETKTATPYVTWQSIGGESIRFLDNTTGATRNTLVQINVWAATRDEALSTIRAIETALCASALFQCRPEGEPVSIYEEETRLRGSIQRFSILG